MRSAGKPAIDDVPGDAAAVLRVGGADGAREGGGGGGGERGGSGGDGGVAPGAPPRLACIHHLEADAGVSCRRNVPPALGDHGGGGGGRGGEPPPGEPHPRGGGA